ncbi:lamin tail domain-containing protein [Streptomyces sp. NBC_01335]|uniref:lamin tail domain-containing protein n=1 Tax=Streptomyces sp. NBC_01335 TaxID=2903828 RepID=UPI002E133D3A|nr:lamin tail domain-containing protein [Streptomyces sp. NBC_01335]
MSRTARRITATVLASGALLAAAALPASADGHDRGHDRVKPAPRSSVVLGKVQYDSPGRDNRSNRSLNDEWVTVTNTSRQAVNLRGWTLTDESRRTYRFDLRLAGRSSVRVHTGVGRDSRTDVYQDRNNYVWDNSDTATLRDSRGRKADEKSWGRHGRDDNRGHGRDDHRDHGRDNRH